MRAVVIQSSYFSHILSYRRLLYVACTRAQFLLYLTHATQRKVSGIDKETSLSTFLAKVRSNPQVNTIITNAGSVTKVSLYPQTRGSFVEPLPPLPREDIVTMSKIIGRDPPDDAEITRRVAEL